MRIDKTPFLRPRLLQKVLLIAITSAALAATGCSRDKPAEGANPAATQGGQPAAAKGAAGPGRPAGAAGTSSMTITTTQVKSLDIVRSVPATGSIHPGRKRRPAPKSAAIEWPRSATWAREYRGPAAGAPVGRHAAG